MKAEKEVIDWSHKHERRRYRDCRAVIGCGLSEECMAAAKTVTCLVTTFEGEMYASRLPALGSLKKRCSELFLMIYAEPDLIVLVS